MTEPVSPFRLTAAQIAELLDPAASLFPELDAARSNLAALKKAPQTRLFLDGSESLMATINQIPQTDYTDYRLFIRSGDRQRYESPYFNKRARFGAAAMRYFFGQTDLKDTVQNYLWNICEESTWVLPAHENVPIDLFSSETAYMLAEALNMLGETIDAEVRQRVRQEIEKRIFDPYIRYHQLHWWWKGGNNWNGVCNSAVAMTFLLLEPELARTARAIELALAGLDVFLHTAYEEDGSSTEGPGYWSYGLLNTVPLSEAMRSRSHGAIDLLSSEHMKLIAGYPPKMVLSGFKFASFSDSHEHTTYNPSTLTRLAERTGETSLLDLLTYDVGNQGDWRIGIVLRNLLWWDGKQTEPTHVTDMYLPIGGVARLVTSSAAGAQVVLAIKAGHNEENHNQNDVGSFIVHAGGDTFLCDPGGGLYTRQYFSPERYKNIFANSYGHSVPRIGGELQAAGRQFEGKFLGVDMRGKVKKAELEIARAYPVASLQRLVRSLTLEPKGDVVLADTFEFSGDAQPVEEAFITWLPVEVQGATAVIRGQKHSLRMTIESPAGATFVAESLAEACRANDKDFVLTRLTFTLPAVATSTARVRMTVE